MTVYEKTSGHDMPNPPPERSATLVRRPAFAAVITFIVALAAVIGAWRIVHDQLQRAALARFEWRAAQTTVELRNKLGACEEILRGASGLIAVTQPALPALSASSAAPVSPDAWRRYVSRLDLDEKQPALRALGYATAATDGVVGLAGDIKADSAPDAKVAADSSASASALVPVTLMYPQRSDAAPLAYDLGRDPSRRGALLRAADTGQPALIARPVAFDTRTDSNRPRFELYLPVYRSAHLAATKEARRADVAGFVVAHLDAGWLLGSLEVHERNIDLQMYAGSPANLLYATSDAVDNAPTHTLFSRTETLRFGGEPLTLIYTTDDRYLGSGDALSAALVLALGVLASFFMGALVFVIARDRPEA
ncbi:CHASE domain-containing protein [Trinickia mobilis]|uniref:CHASE domain-containing protein n=1 Tax=Trinickia mobilis TaxID=2816356 RepID=UPI001A8CCF3C|nr:CHASE domain-containing protein [Trinickia mobilis]